MKKPLWAASLLVAMGASTSVSAEVIQTSDNGFITRDSVVVEANPTETWLALTNPADWWSAEHTWSADSANLRLTPQAGGCFCEKIPEVDEPDRFTLEGSVEHMRVIQAYPESALRMVGGLGPLQSEPVNGVLTIALTPVDTPEGKGTRIVWEYNVGGSMRYEIPVISKAVDGVMSVQLAGLAEKLGKVEVVAEEEPVEESSEPDEASDADAEETDDAAPETEDQGDETPEAEAPEDDDGPSVEEAFGDLSDEGTGN
ncbi:MAG: SRPBCC family protein [Pseudomonadota bacterium]